MLSILLVAALSGAWDDETFLGRGPMVGAGAAVAITRHLSAEGEFGWASQHRDAGYLAADGTPVTATGRLSFAFRGRDAAARPFVSAGASWVRSTGHFTTPSGRIEWQSNARAWEFGAGVAIKTSDRFTIRPEARWTMTGGARSFTPGSLEPPLVIIRGGMTLVWTSR